MEHGRFEFNQGARIRSVKSDDRNRSFDSHTSKASSLQQDDDRFPSYVQLYKSMIVKCVECSHLLPRMRDIFDDQGTNLSYHSCKCGLFKIVINDVCYICICMNYVFKLALLVNEIKKYNVII